MSVHLITFPVVFRIEYRTVWEPSVFHCVVVIRLRYNDYSYDTAFNPHSGSREGQYVGRSNGNKQCCIIRETREDDRYGKRTHTEEDLKQ